MSKRAPFIVIDGIDGSGKGTQVQLLKEHYERRGRVVGIVDFPRYASESSFFVKKYLNGGYGSLDEVGPYRASLLYAVDRFDAKQDIQELIEQCDLVISNRYVSANLIHQAAKIKTLPAVDVFVDWDQEMEYTIFGIPKPTQTILLHVEPKTSEHNIEQKEGRQYIIDGSNKDVHEKDPHHLAASAKRAKYVADKLGWHVVLCDKGGQMREKEDITRELVAYIDTI